MSWGKTPGLMTSEDWLWEGSRTAAGELDVYVHLAGYIQRAGWNPCCTLSSPLILHWKPETETIKLILFALVFCFLFCWGFLDPKCKALVPDFQACGHLQMGTAGAKLITHQDLCTNIAKQKWSVFKMHPSMTCETVVRKCKNQEETFRHLTQY